MASITDRRSRARPGQRIDKPWQVRWREAHPGRPHDASRPRSCARSFRLKRDAEQLLPVVEQYEPGGMLWGGSYRDRSQTPAAVTVEDLAVAWLDELEVTGSKKSRTVTEYERRLESWRLFLVESLGVEQPLVVSMSRELLVAFREDLGHRVAHNNANAIVTTVSQWWRWAWETDEVGTVPRPQRLLLKDKARPQRRALTWAQLDTMLDLLASRSRTRRGGREDWELRACLLARYTGMREESALLLEWDDVHLDQAALWLRPETLKGTKRGLWLPIHQGLRAELAGWGLRDGRVCPWTNTSVSAAKSSLSERVRSQWGKTSLDPALYARQPFHGFRRTLSTHLRSRGLYQEAELLLGHSARLSTGDTEYTDTAPGGAFWPRLVEAVGTVPAVGEGASVLGLRRRGASGE